MPARSNLKDLCILVTRPRPQGEILCAQIEANGGRAIYFPTIDIAPPQDFSAFQHQLLQINQYDWLIFISPQAVYHSVKLLPVLSNTVKIAAVGASTAKALRDANLSVDLFPEQEWSSEGLLALPEMQAVQNKKIGILKGEGGREWLADQLTARGATVTALLAYRRCLPEMQIQSTVELVLKNKINAIICTSSEGMHNLKKLLTPVWEELRQIPILVISPRLSEEARELGFDKILLGKNASLNVILNALVKENTHAK